MNELKYTSGLCIHTITTKPWSLEEALEHYSEKNIGGISVWKETYDSIGAIKAGEAIRQYPIQVVSLVRGGFFAHHEADKRKKAINENKKLLDDAAAIGAPLLVLVCGNDPAQSLETSRAQISEAIEKLLPHAESVGVKLGIEPLHPMYSDTRSAINTLSLANDIAERIDSPFLGVVVDVYHVWWDAGLQQEIRRCGANNNLFAYHICDWKVPTMDLLNDRGLMGEGCIPLKQIREWVENAGFNGYNEVEIFSDHYWSQDQHIFLDSIINAYLTMS